MLDIVEGKTVLEAVFDTPRQGMNGTGIVGTFAVFITLLLGDSFNGCFEIASSPWRAALGFCHFAEGAVQQILLLLGHLRQEMTHIADLERRDTHLDLLWLIDFNLRLIATAFPIALLAELRRIGDFTQRTILTMRIEDEHTGFIVRLHEFLDDHAGEITFTGTSAGDNRQVRTDNIFD